MIGGLGASAICGFVKNGEDMNRAAGVAFVIVPFVNAMPALWEGCCRGVRIIRDQHHTLLYGGMTIEIRTDEFSIPRPIVFCVGCRVYSDETTTLCDILFEGNLLRLVKHITGCVEEDHCIECRESLLGKDTWILRGCHLEMVCASQAADRFDARFDAGVPESFGPGKNENMRIILFGWMSGCSVPARAWRETG